MRFDLHIHTCLSPCADLEMAPRAIAERARAVGLDAIAVVDHNSGLNAPALFESCRDLGLGCLYGIEITSSEEAHLLALFDTPDSAARLTATIYKHLPARPNPSEIFGEQPIVNAASEILCFEEKMLSAPTNLSLPAIEKLTHALDGLLIAAHVDRPIFSLFSQLGVLSGDEGLDACELSAHADAACWRPRTGAFPLVRSSDAHYLADIGRAWSEAPLAEWSVAALRAALRAGSVKISPPAHRHV